MKNPYCANPACSGPACEYQNLHPPNDAPELVKWWWWLLWLRIERGWNMETALAAAKELEDLRDRKHTCDKHCSKFTHNGECYLAATIHWCDTHRYDGWVLSKYEK